MPKITKLTGMRKFTKWIGAGLGWTIGGPIGALAGFALGSLVDASNIEQFENTATDTTTGDFVVSLLVLLAAVMKADRRVMQSELTFVKQYLVRTFGEAEALEMLGILRNVLKQDIPLKEVTQQIKGRMDYPSRLELIHLIYGIAQADGDISGAEMAVIEQIAVDLGLSGADILSVKNMYFQSADWAYKVLEIDSRASNEDIKKAYRQLALKNHPDKVSYLGEEIWKKAQDKFQKINEAYEAIKKERKMI
jgi:DnaJ like chaperone protein